MAIVRIDSPSDPLAALSDWTKMKNWVSTLYLMMNGPIIRISGGNVQQGSVFQIGGAVYQATSDTAISGSASDYVQITAQGASASAAYVADLTGVTWNQEYNGYYDGSDRLYVFDESQAIINGHASDYKIAQPDYVRRAGNQTIGGIKTFTSQPVAPDGIVDQTFNQTIGGIKTFTSIPVGPASDPTTDNQLTRKYYVDGKVAAIDSYPNSGSNLARSVLDTQLSNLSPFFSINGFLKSETSGLVYIIYHVDLSGPIEVWCIGITGADAGVPVIFSLASGGNLTWGYSVGKI